MPRDLLLYLLAAVSLALAYPPFRYGFLAYWAFIPFLLLLEDKNFGSAMRWSYGIGLIVSVTVLCDNLWLSLPTVISFALIQPLYFVLFGIAFVALRKTWPTGYLMLVPLLWAVVEYARSFNEPAAPSLKLGYTQAYFMQLMQYAPSASVYAVSFWIVALNVLLLGMWRMRENPAACLSLIVLLFLLFALPYLFNRYTQQRAREWREHPIEVRAELRDSAGHFVALKLL